MKVSTSKFSLLSLTKHYFKQDIKRDTLLRNEQGSLLLEALVALVILTMILYLSPTTFNIQKINHQLFETSNNLQQKNLTKLSKVLSKKIAGQSNLGEVVVFKINSPNYLSQNGKKYLNLFEDYEITGHEYNNRGLQPLEIYNTILNNCELSVQRTGINTYHTNVKMLRPSYLNYHVVPVDLRPSEGRIAFVGGQLQGVVYLGTPDYYEFEIMGDIE